MDCGKRMAKKNWKDHARNKHTMSEETIKKKYEQLKPSSSSSASKDIPTPITMRNFFSTKKFAMEVQDPEQQKDNDVITTAHPILIEDETNVLTPDLIADVSISIDLGENSCLELEGNTYQQFSRIFKHFQCLTIDPPSCSSKVPCLFTCVEENILSEIDGRNISGEGKLLFNMFIYFIFIFAIKIICPNRLSKNFLLKMTRRQIRQASMIWAMILISLLHHYKRLPMEYRIDQTLC